MAARLYCDQQKEWIWIASKFFISPVQGSSELYWGVKTSGVDPWDLVECSRKVEKVEWMHRCADTQYAQYALYSSVFMHFCTTLYCCTALVCQWTSVLMHYLGVLMHCTGPLMHCSGVLMHHGGALMQWFAKKSGFPRKVIASAAGPWQTWSFFSEFKSISDLHKKSFMICIQR